MKLYHYPGSRSNRVMLLLEEMEVSYSIIRTDIMGTDVETPEYGKLHPLGRVPVLIDEFNGKEVKIFESGAICQYLTEKYSEKRLAPAINDPQRPYFLQWMFFCSVHLDQVSAGMFTEPGDAGYESAKKNFHKVLSVIENALNGNPFFLGNQFSAIDAMAGATLMWHRDKIEMFPNVTEYVARIRDRKSFKTLMTKNELLK